MDESEVSAWWGDAAPGVLVKLFLACLSIDDEE